MHSPKLTGIAAHDGYRLAKPAPITNYKLILFCFLLSSVFPAFFHLSFPSDNFF